MRFNLGGWRFWRSEADAGASGENVDTNPEKTGGSAGRSTVADGQGKSLSVGYQNEERDRYEGKARGIEAKGDEDHSPAGAIAEREHAENLMGDGKRGGADRPRPSDLELGDDVEDIHGVVGSGLLTLWTVMCFGLYIVLGAPVDWRHAIVGAAGYGMLAVAAYLAARVRPVKRRFPPPFTDSRFTFALVGYVGVIWKTPALLEAAPGALAIVVCVGGFVDGLCLGRVAANRGCSFGGALKAVWAGAKRA